MPKSYEDDIRDILDRMDNFLPEKRTTPAGPPPSLLRPAVGGR